MIFNMSHKFYAARASPTWQSGKVPTSAMSACKSLDSLRGCCLRATTIRTVITAAATKQPDEAKSNMAARRCRPSPSSPSTSRVFLYNRRKLKDEVLDLREALRALRAYSLSLIPETVELSCRVRPDYQESRCALIRENIIRL